MYWDTSMELTTLRVKPLIHRSTTPGFPSHRLLRVSTIVLRVSSFSTCPPHKLAILLGLDCRGVKEVVSRTPRFFAERLVAAWVTGSAERPLSSIISPAAGAESSKG